MERVGNRKMVLHDRAKMRRNRQGVFRGQPNVHCPLTTAWHTRTSAISNKKALRSKKLSAPSGNGTLSVTQTMTPSLTNMEATLLHGSNLRPRNGLASLSAGRVASRSPTVTGSRGFSITDATLNARPALNKQSGKSEWI